MEAYAPVTPLFVSTFSRWAAGWELPRLGSAIQAASQTWPVANTAFYVPFWLPFPYPVKRIFWVNSSSVTSANIDVGIYTIDGIRLYSTGSIAMASASLPQYVTPSPELYLTPGRYYMGVSCSSITANRGCQGSIAPTVPKLRMAGLLQEASALPLPATMTGVAVANAMYPLCGITRTASGFA